MEKVTVNRGLLVGLAAVAALSLLGVAFLLGRASGSGNALAPADGPGLPVGASSSVVVHRASEPAVPPAQAMAPEPAPLAPSGVILPAPVAAPPPEPYAAPRPDPEPAPVSRVAARASADPERGAVAAYLDAIDRIQPAQVSGSAENAANELATALAKGDTSGLDAMIRDSEAAKAKLSALVPPAPCAGHYRESLASLDDALGMLRSLKGAMESPDPVGALVGVAGRATELRSRAEALQREDAALRQRYGLNR